MRGRTSSRFTLDAFPPFARRSVTPIHPLIWANMRPGGFTVDGAPARLVADDDTRRVRIINEQHD